MTGLTGSTGYKNLRENRRGISDPFPVLPGIFLILVAFSPRVHSETNRVEYCPVIGVIREIQGDTALIEPQQLFVKKSGVNVGFLDALDAFVPPGSKKALIAEVDIYAISDKTQIQGELIRVRLKDSKSGKPVTVLPGRKVLIHDRLKRGQQYVRMNDPMSPRLVYEESFDTGKSLGTCWESVPGALAITNGQLVLDRYKEELRGVRDPNGGEMRIKMQEMGSTSKQPFYIGEITRGAVAFEFDLVKNPGIRIALDKKWYGRHLIGADCVIGRYKNLRSGIFVKGRRVAGITGGSFKQCHVVMKITPAFLELAINEHKCRFEPDKPLTAGGFWGLVVYCQSKCIMDNFRIFKLPELLSGAHSAVIVAFNPARERLAVLRGSGKEWQGELEGKIVLFTNKASDVPIPAKVTACTGDYLICVPRTSHQKIELNAAVTLSGATKKKPTEK
ncbi:hypothetical protein ACFLQR_03950 [Verrucomicrobiota bacterium]